MATEVLAATTAAALRESFDRLPVPNYATEDGWLRRRFPGGKVQDPAVFYVHPTTERTLEAWFSSHSAPATLAGTGAVVEEHGHAFPGNMWAPAYRQATTRAFHQNQRGGSQAYDLAFEDVWRAFVVFLQDVPEGPIVLSGHSQGARHVVQILATLTDGTQPDRSDVAARIVAAYAIGIGIPDHPAVLAAFPLPVTREDTGVLIGWNAMLDADSNPASSRATERTAVDPITFSSADGADLAAVHQGGLRAPFDEMRVSVACDEDVVRVRQVAGDDLSLYALPGGSLHAVEVQLFAGDIRDDLRRRTRTWRERHLARST